MSRDLNILSQLEYDLEVRKQDRLPHAPADRASANTEVASGRRSAETGDEEMIGLVQNTFLQSGGTAVHQVVFCGVDSGAGSSSVCARAGVTLAANTAGAVCLVDANVSSSLSRLLRVEPKGSFYSQSGTLKDRCVQLTGNLWLAETNILGGSGSSLPAASEVKRRLAQLRDEFDYILIDAAGATLRVDAAVIGQAAGAVILVVEANSTRRAVARKAKNILDGAGVRVLGTVLHNRSFPIPEALYKRL